MGRPDPGWQVPLVAQHLERDVNGSRDPPRPVGLGKYLRVPSLLPQRTHPSDEGDTVPTRSLLRVGRWVPVLHRVLDLRTQPVPGPLSWLPGS